MKVLTIQATKREVLGKKNSVLRRQGQTPVHLFGHSIQSQSLQCDTMELKKILGNAGTTRLINLKVKGEKEPKVVFVREIQRDAFGKQLIHVDFYQIRKDEKMHMNVPIVLVGEAPALKGKGRLLTHGTTELSIECLPDNVPPQIDVDISILEEVDQEIFVKDIKVGTGVTVLTDADQLVVKVSEVYVKPEAEGAAVEGEESAEESAEEAASE